MSELRPVGMPQPHGGTLQVGNPGNSGGIGRPTPQIRARCRGSFLHRIPILEQIADGTLTETVDSPTGPQNVLVPSPLAERLKAIDMLGKYGGLQVIAVESDQPPVPEGGEALMGRVLAMIGRALLAAPAHQRLAVLRELEAGPSAEGGDAP